MRKTTKTPGEKIVKDIKRAAPINVHRVCLLKGADLPVYALPHWQALFDGRLDVFEHLGDPAAMMRGGGVMQVAEQISDWLDQEAAP